jgi:hypothetical protein
MTKRFNYHANVQAFAEPLTKEAQYWIGFLLADGGVNGNAIQIKLHRKDRTHLVKLALFLNLPLSSVKDYCYFLPKTEKYQITSSIGFRNQVIVDQLAKYGIVPRKSLIAQVHPDLEESFDFWRGMIDGDGTIMMAHPLNANPSPRIGFCGSVSVVTKFSEFVSKITDRLPKVQLKQKIAATQVGGPRGKMVASAVYYDGCYPALDRKMKNAQECKEWNPSDKSHCKKGHPRTPENTYYYTNGKSTCKICRKQSPSIINYKQKPSYIKRLIVNRHAARDASHVEAILAKLKIVSNLSNLGV